MLTVSTPAVSGPALVGRSSASRERLRRGAHSDLLDLVAALVAEMRAVPPAGMHIEVALRDLPEVSELASCLTQL